ncbi:MAG: Tripartite ATP-independent periplasmic transporter, DctQ component [Ramlibacter sp.]|nr:Tripartite ATP-independent periplasmic transporter, DctQ component [Ramlibacter sp.]
MIFLHPPLKKLLLLVCGLLSGGALFAIMALTFADVSARKLLDNSIPGSLEMTELLMVVVIFGALPLVSLRGEHVVFDSLDSYFSPAALRAQKALIHLLSAAALLGLGWLMWKTAGQFALNGETTAQLKLAKAPFIYGMAVLCAVTGIVHLVLTARPPEELAEGEGTAL